MGTRTDGRRCEDFGLRILVWKANHLIALWVCLPIQNPQSAIRNSLRVPPPPLVAHPPAADGLAGQGLGLAGADAAVVAVAPHAGVGDSIPAVAALLDARAHRPADLSPHDLRRVRLGRLRA